MDTGSTIAAAAFAGTGLMCIIFGQLGQAGKMDFNLASYTRENTTPESWQLAHQIMGRVMVHCGWVQVGGAAIVLVFGLDGGFGWSGFTIAVLSSLMPVAAMWPTFRALEKRSGSEPPTDL